MKLPCSVIKDILPLYVDGVCSPESRALVNEHLNECAECRTFLTQMNETIPVENKEPDALKPLISIRTEWLRTKKKALLKGVLITLVIVGILFGGFFGATEIKFPVAAEDITISDVSMLSNGVISFHLIIDDGKELRELTTKVDCEDGVAYITPKRALIEQKRMFDHYSSLNDQYYYAAFQAYTLKQFVEKDYDNMPPSDESTALADFFYPTDIRKICIGTKNDHIVLWEAGMELPAATEEREEIYYSGIR